MKKSEIFFREFVLGVGFVSGFWIALGVNPEAVIFESFREVMETINPDSGFGYLFTLIPLLSTVCSLIGAYTMGGKVGIFALALAFVGGLVFLSGPLMSVILLIASMFIGSVGVDNNRNGTWI